MPSGTEPRITRLNTNKIRENMAFLLVAGNYCGTFLEMKNRSYKKLEYHYFITLQYNQLLHSSPAQINHLLPLHKGSPYSQIVTSQGSLSSYIISLVSILWKTFHTMN